MFITDTMVNTTCEAIVLWHIIQYCFNLFIFKKNIFPGIQKHKQFGHKPKMHFPTTKRGLHKRFTQLEKEKLYLPSWWVGFHFGPDVQTSSVPGAELADISCMANQARSNCLTAVKSSYLPIRKL